MCRYLVACDATSALGPNQPTTVRVAGSTMTVTTAPISAASQRPSTPWASAPSVSPAPTRRATEAVVP
jgi:hypothetical protein